MSFSIYDIIKSKRDESVEESILFNEKDIYYNKDKFDSGEINLCFITGHSGSGKSTMGRDMQSKNIEHYELDDLQCIKDRFTMDNLKEYGDLIYSYFNGPGKRFYITHKELVDNNIPGSEYEDIMYKDFVHYAMKYSNLHKDRKFILEGIWFFCNGENGKPWFKPEEFKEYAFYIKGTSIVVSKYRAAKRDANDVKNNKVPLRFMKNFFLNKWKDYLINENRINIFRKYFSELSMKSVNESVSTKQIQLYFISTRENIKSLTPRIPDNFFTRKGYEDNKTPRVCFSTDIGKCLMALSMKCADQKYYVYQPAGEYEVITPTKKQVPDVEITDEKWICKKVEVECIGEILCIGDKGEDGIPYTYGSNDEYKAELYEWNWKWTKKYKSIIQESVSTIDKDFKSNGKKSLSNFKKVHITEAIIDKYKKEYPMLRHVRCKDTKDYICDGYIWLDNEKLVCMVGSCEYTDDNTKWIVSLEIIKDYRGYGLSSQILDYAVKNMNCKYLSVNKKNEVAKRIYDNYGFKVYHEDNTMYYMTIDINKL